MYGTASKISQYLVPFLLGDGNEALVSLISYGNNKNVVLVIEPSDFFEKGIYLTDKSLPMLPLCEIEGIPILFGNTNIWEEDGQIHLGADLIASAFFLLSRYEECVRRDVRDQHGRFPGRESLSYRAGFLERPIVEEYGALLRRLLRRAGVDVKEPQVGLRHIWLTHDVDQIWTWDNYYRALRTTLKNFITGQPDKLRPLRAYHDYQNYDPVYTFPWLIEQDNSVRNCCGTERCTPVYFLMGCVKKQNNDNGYLSNKERTKQLIKYLQAENCELGYHVSYTASMNLGQIKSEILRIQELSDTFILWSRNHYLASREPEDFRSLINNGITDDFTMGYADEAGFRLGTCRPVKWIDPIKLEVTELTLHPMTIMECTLDGRSYMNIQQEEEAFAVVEKLIEEIASYAGEVVLLWHSPSVFPKQGSYQRNLYEKVLKLLIDLS